MIESSCGIMKRRKDILSFEIGQIFKYLIKTQPCSQQIQYIDYSYSHSANTRTPAALLRIHCDSVN